MEKFRAFDSLDKDMQGVVEQLMNFKAPPLTTLTPDNARNCPTFKNAVEEMASHSALARTLNVALPAMPEPVKRTEQILIPTQGGKVGARVYYPTTDAVLAPVVVYFHGGGWVIANLDVYDSSCRALCNAMKAIVISVAYRQAPEHPFPAPVQDASDALQWVLTNATSFAGDPAKVIVAGESAGGNLATVACLAAKSLGVPMPAAQLLIYPVTDTSMSQMSYAENEDTVPLQSSMMPWFWKHYLTDESQREDPLVSPLQAEDLSGLPPAIIITAEFDPLRDEAQQYAERLEDAGVPVWYRQFDGVVHEFFGLTGAVSKAKDAVKFAADCTNEILKNVEAEQSADVLTPV
jgi:acetyl esterase